MQPVNPTRTVHFVIARFFAQRLGGDTPSAAFGGDSLLAWTLTSEYADPDGRSDYAVLVNYAWALLGFACGVLMLVCSYLAHLAIGDEGVRAVVTTSMGLACFCFAGCVNALWRRCLAYQARRGARIDGVASDRYVAAMRRALPRNSSLISQSIVGIVAAFITAISW
jgi:hypothetical protein